MRKEKLEELKSYIEELKTIKTESQGAVYLRAYEKNGDCVFTSPISFR